MYITLDKIRQHLNILPGEAEFDNDYLIFLGQAAEDAIEKHLNCPLSHLMTDEGYIPNSVQQAILLLIGNLYNNREPVALSGNPIKIPYTLEYLINLNRNYRTKF